MRNCTRYQLRWFALLSLLFVTPLSARHVTAATPSQGATSQPALHNPQTTPLTAEQATSFHWPAGKIAAVSLAYDDALDSQLDVAVVQLNKAGLKASFYLPLAAPTLQTRLADWRAVAAAGHELGNHSLFHQCRKSLPGRDWVAVTRNLDSITAAEMAEQVQLGNVFLQAIDGETARTYTAPCTDALAQGQPYLPLLAGDFVAMKTQVGGVIRDMQALDIQQVPVVTPSNVSGDELIAMVKQAGAVGGMINFTFHGVGGDHLAVSRQAHQQLVDFLAANPQYWTTTFIEQMRYVQAQQAKLNTQQVKTSAPLAN